MQQKVIDIDAAKPIGDSLAALQLTPRPVVILLGDFDASLSNQVRSVCNRVLAPVALDPGCFILDDGSSPCANLMGVAAADHDRMAMLMAIVPHDAPNIDANHEVVLRLPAEWQDTVKYTFQIADAMTNVSAVKQPALVILVGGAERETKAVIRAAQRDWPVLVLKGSGGLADQIAASKTPQPDGTMPPPPADPGLREIFDTASIYLWSIGGSMDDLNRIVLSRIETSSASAAATLAEAWQRFDVIDAAANAKQQRFRNIEMSLILLAVLAALAAILTTTTKFPEATKRGLALHILVILVPITLSIIAAYNSHFRDGNKWILLRGAAEALKREIFRFRAKAGVYSDEQCLDSSREAKLAARIRDITSAMEQSEVNKIGLPRQPRGEEPRATFLSPDDYLSQRLRDQADYFVKKTGGLSKQLTGMQLFIYLVGGVGTFLAAIHVDVWVALSTAVVTALTTKLQADQVETSLVQYNQALVSLKNIETWWKALSGWEKDRRKNIDVLVDQTEKTLESETAGWVQQMQSALDKLTEKEPSAKAGGAS